jgi:hypothetical protein
MLASEVKGCAGELLTESLATQVLIYRNRAQQRGVAVQLQRGAAHNAVSVPRDQRGGHVIAQAIGRQSGPL